MATGVLKFWNDPLFTIPRVDQVVPYPREDTDTPLHTLNCCVSHPSLEPETIPTESCFGKEWLNPLVVVFLRAGGLQLACSM